MLTLAGYASLGPTDRLRHWASETDLKGNRFPRDRAQTQAETLFDIDPHDYPSGLEWHTDHRLPYIGPYGCTLTLLRLVDPLIALCTKTSYSTPLNSIGVAIPDLVALLHPGGECSSTSSGTAVTRHCQGMSPSIHESITLYISSWELNGAGVSYSARDSTHKSRRASMFEADNLAR